MELLPASLSWRIFITMLDEWELYDRKKDPLELNNVYDDPAYADVLSTLKEQLLTFEKNTKTLTNLIRNTFRFIKKKG